MATRRSKRLQEKTGDIPNKSVDDDVHRRNVIDDGDRRLNNSNNNKRSPLKSLLRRSMEKISRSRRKPRSVTFQSPLAKFQKDGDDLAKELSTKMDLGQDDPVVNATEATATMTIDSNLVISDEMSVEVSTTQYANVQVKDTIATYPARGEPDEEPSNRQEDATTTPTASEDDLFVIATPHRRRSSRMSLSKLSRSDLQAGQRPRYLSDIKGKGVLEYLQELLPSIFNLFKMMTPETYDDRGQRTSRWPRIQAYLVLVDQVQSHPGSGDPSKRDRDRIIVTGFGFEKDHSKDLFMNAMQNAVFFDWMANEKAEYIFSTGVSETMDAVLN